MDSLHADIVSLTQALQHELDGNGDASLPQSSDPDMCRLIQSCAALIERQAREKALAQTSRSQKENAIAGIVHDLRIPLSVMMGCADVLAGSLPLPLEKKQEYLQALITRGTEMAALLDQLSKTNHAVKPFLIHPVPTKLAQWIRDTLSLWQDSLTEENVSIHLSLSDDLTLPIDRLAFRRILSNLISNTVKYRTQRSSHIEITLIPTDRMAVLTFQDDGPGLPNEESISHLFDPGWRAPETSAHIPGHGLGLYIISQLIKAHGGTISAHMDHGLVFQMVLPLQEVNDVKHTDC